MCRKIKRLFNFDPPVSTEGIQAASLQFVRKINGFNKPSRANEASFLVAVDEIAEISTRLIHSLETNAPLRNREEKAAKAKARAKQALVPAPTAVPPAPTAEQEHKEKNDQYSFHMDLPP